jgi:hypothetical protein
MRHNSAGTVRDIFVIGRTGLFAAEEKFAILRRDFDGRSREKNNVAEFELPARFAGLLGIPAERRSHRDQGAEAGSARLLKGGSGGHS